MSNGWDSSAQAWIDSMGERGERGDWGRQHVLDPMMMERVKQGRFKTAIDVGCGEGRFCRMLKTAGVRPTGIDLTRPFIELARERDPGGDYRLGRAEQLEFADGSFDLAVSYITLIDIPDFRAAIREMARVLRPGGALLMANLTGFTSACANRGWVKDANGEHLHFPVDNYLREFAFWFEWSGIKIENWHRPLEAYMSAFLEAGLNLNFFAEPPAVSGAEVHRERQRRVPWFVVMEWQKPN
jgi:2-polyprenyl-3-methyl-5-hydroxy-6-metoxy-1,4-benzoquinol methylase